MGWEELAESLDDLETKEVYDGYFCSVKDAVVISFLAVCAACRILSRFMNGQERNMSAHFLRKNLESKGFRATGGF